MADVTSAIYQFVLPEVAASDDTWGTKLNADLAKLETLFVDAFTGGSPTTLGTLKDARMDKAWGTATLTFDIDGAKNIQWRTTALVQEAAIGVDSGNIPFWQRVNSGGSALARLRLQSDGAIEATTGFFKGSGSGLFGVAGLAAAVNGPITFDGDITALDRFVAKQNSPTATSGFMIRDEAANELGSMLFSLAGDSIKLRNLQGGSTNSQLELMQDGTLNWTGTHNGIEITQGVATTIDDVTGHLNLYNDVYGLNVTSNFLNVVTNGQVRFVTAAGVVLAATDTLDTGTVGDETIMTRLKGDTRYRNASNLNAGTVPVARLPEIPMDSLEVGSAAETWVGTRIAGMVQNQLGSYAFVLWQSGDPGDTKAGSALSYAGVKNTGSPIVNTGTLSGTWRLMGFGNSVDGASLALRIA
jgi:hypothetical protein